MHWINFFKKHFLSVLVFLVSIAIMLFSTGCITSNVSADKEPGFNEKLTKVFLLVRSSESTWDYR
jgi:hypothetical protein